MSEKKQQPAYPLRMPAELREHLEETAGSNKRSLNAEIIARLEASLGQHISEQPTIGELIDVIMRMAESSGRSVSITLGEPENTAKGKGEWTKG